MQVELDKSREEDEQFKLEFENLKQRVEEEKKVISMLLLRMHMTLAHLGSEWKITTSKQTYNLILQRENNIRQPNPTNA